jgi:hypothetical protein
MNSTSVRDPAGGGDDIDLVAKLALDSAEVASRSARAAAHTASKLSEASAKFDLALARQRKQTILLASFGGFVVLLAFAMFLASSIQMRGRVTQVNAMLGVLATRSVELRSGLDQIAPLAERVEGFATQVAAMNRMQRELQASVQRMDQTLATLPAAPVAAVVPPPTPAPAGGAAALKAQPATSKPVAPVESSEQVAAREKLLRQTLDAAQAVATQARALESNLRAQSAALSGLGTRVSAIERSVAALPDMQSDLKALLRGEQARASALEKVVSEREREEGLRNERERFVQYPRQTNPPGAPQTGAPGPQTDTGVIRR